MKTLPVNLILEKNKLSQQYPWILLLEIVLTNPADDTDTVTVRFARNFENVSFGGNTYIAFPFILEPSKFTSEGDIPTTTLRLSSITRYIQSYLEDYNGAVGSPVTITVVNTNRLAEDYSELELNFEVISTVATDQHVDLVLGAPSPLRRRFPLDRYLAQHCRFQYEEIECAYVGKTITNITQAMPGVVTSTAHGFRTGDTIYISGVVGMTEVNDNTYIIAKITADTYSLLGVNTSGYGAYVSGGVGGYSSCDKKFSSCADRENVNNFGGFLGMKSGGLRIA